MAPTASAALATPAAIAGRGIPEPSSAVFEAADSAGGVGAMEVGGAGVAAGAALVVGVTVVEVVSVVGGGLAGVPGLDCSPE